MQTLHQESLHPRAVGARFQTIAFRAARRTLYWRSGPAQVLLLKDLYHPSVGRAWARVGLATQVLMDEKRVKGWLCHPFGTRHSVSVSLAFRDRIG
jgi:hypothetical protein